MELLNKNSKSEKIVKSRKAIITTDIGTKISSERFFNKDGNLIYENCIRFDKANNELKKGQEIHECRYDKNGKIIYHKNTVIRNGNVHIHEENIQRDQYGFIESKDMNNFRKLIRDKVSYNENGDLKYCEYTLQYENMPDFYRKISKSYEYFSEIEYGKEISKVKETTFDLINNKKVSCIIYSKEYPWLELERIIYIDDIIYSKTIRDINWSLENRIESIKVFQYFDASANLQISSKNENNFHLINEKLIQKKVFEYDNKNRPIKIHYQINTNYNNRYPDRIEDTQIKYNDNTNEIEKNVLCENNLYTSIEKLNSNGDIISTKTYFTNLLTEEKRETETVSYEYEYY